jgi:hypothetical protein
MELSDLANQVSGFDGAAPGEKIRLFAWFLHTHRDMATFKTTDIRACYEKLHLPVPNIAMYLIRMAEASPAKALRKGDDYNLTRAARTDLDAKYGIHQSIIQVSKILSDLPVKIPNVDQRTFLTEALKCYKVEAYRACVIMTWNLAYAHLLDWILSDQTRLDRFNAAISKRYQKMTALKISTYDEFLDELKESQVIEICNSASLFNSNIFKILKDKLDRRNIAAHPSSVVVVQSQADDVVTDLVNNVVLALN